ncbi:MAG: Fic family protein [Gaiellales bacterium]
MTTVQRRYLESHPWIQFKVDLTYAGAPFWMLLGEARSKVDHLAWSLLKPDVRDEMLKVYLAKGAQATTAIEGNTLSEDEVAAIVAGTAASPPPSQEYLYREVENILGAFNRIKDHLLAGGGAEITPDVVKGFNSQVLDGLDQDDVRPGEIRRQSVIVGGYRGAPWEDCDYLLDRMCEWLNGPDFQTDDPDWETPFALLRAAMAHLYIAWIHPFDDGNGRTARLVEVLFLLAAGVPMPAAHLLSNHYNLTRTEYYRQLDRASASGGDPVQFVRYAIRGFVDGIRVQIDRAWQQQYADRWEQFVYETFGGSPTSDAGQRRLHLVLELSARDDPVPRREIPRMTPELALAYADTERMLSRDLNALEVMGLIRQVKRGLWAPAREQILAFRPLRRQSA